MKKVMHREKETATDHGSVGGFFFGEKKPIVDYDCKQLSLVHLKTHLKNEYRSKSVCNTINWKWK